MAIEQRQHRPDRSETEGAPVARAATGVSTMDDVVMDPDVAAHETEAAEAERREAARAEDERRLDADEAPELAAPRSLRSRLPAPVRRITKVQAVALVLLTLLTLGPAVALVLILRADVEAHPELVSEGETPPSGGVLLQLTVTNVNAVSGEMQTRIRVVPDSSLLVPGGGLKSELTLVSNDIQGKSVVVMPANQAPGPTAIVTAVSSGSVSRYPFDRYEAGLQLIVSQQVNGKRQEVPTTVSIEGGVSDMAISADLEPDQESLLGRVATMQIRRSAPTLVFTSWMMILWWALSVSAVFMVWSVAIWRSTVPPWAYGFFVGVLFALTPLRGALPGSPPYGVLVDYVSFYWAIAIVGIGLMMLVAFFIRDARAQSRQLAQLELDRAREDRAATRSDAHDRDDTAVAEQTHRRATPPDG
jgi:hypothetical protein